MAEETQGEAEMSKSHKEDKRTRFEINTHFIKAPGALRLAHLFNHEFHAIQ